MTLPEKFKLVQINWMDTSAHNEWYDRDELEAIVDGDLLMMQSVGWLVKLDDEQVVIARTIGDSHADGVLKIPRAVVVDMFDLKAVSGVMTIEIPDGMPDYFMRKGDDD